jgi:hypothetical protein
MNEPVWPKKKPSRDEFPDGVQICEAWLTDSGKLDGPDVCSQFEVESTKAYINRIDKLLYDQRVPAVPCWNLLWSKGPIYQGPEKTTEEDADRFGNAALSFALCLSAYADEHVFIHAGDVKGNFVELPPIPRRVVGYGALPLIQSSGRGLYFLEAVFEGRMVCGRWTLKFMPHTVFKEDLSGNIEDSPGGVVVSSEEALPMTIDIPRMKQTDWEGYRLEGDRRIRVETRSPEITFTVKPGNYEILRE